jgi:hypothetical protein
METYDVPTQTNGLPNNIESEDRVTKNIESYTAAIPSSAYLGVAVGAMALSLFCHRAREVGLFHSAVGAHLVNLRRL